MSFCFQKDMASGMPCSSTNEPCLFTRGFADGDGDGAPIAYLEPSSSGILKPDADPAPVPARSLIVPLSGTVSMPSARGIDPSTSCFNRTTMRVVAVAMSRACARGLCSSG